MLNRTIILGTTTHIPVSFVGSDGYPIDHTVGSRVTRLRLSLITNGVAASVPTYTLDTTDSGEFSWTSQAEGTGYWLFEADDVFTVGDYVASVVYADPADTPDTVYLLGEARYTIRNPVTGAL